jgi:hypothetical protein
MIETFIEVTRRYLMEEERYFHEVGREQLINLITENVDGNEENRSGAIAGTLPSKPNQQATQAHQATD